MVSGYEIGRPVKLLLEKAGFKAVLLNEIDKDACQTMKTNRPEWDVRHDDIANIDFKPFAGKIDFLSGGFPCQAFSYAGKKLGFEDIRGTLFYQFARAVKEAQPKVFLGENVRGLLKHDNGRTLVSFRQDFLKNQHLYDFAVSKSLNAVLMGVMFCPLYLY